MLNKREQMGKMLGETPGIGGHFMGQAGNSMNSMRVTLVMTPSTGKHRI